ncbi:ferrochelatase [Plasticicumulans lactativorans]|uniref:Ferrochelatase n=1 Tax=Plasticicumulans lactativorans TaxID=1133106 RepID=A0A4R2L2U7_9GAMM|nr:ferrochelatase [Plasticicumulans lactativorans]TCO79547.1 ferrochelatase [Plasticicumulans lactativorans]
MTSTDVRPFRHGREPATGILLCNLGTPAAPTAAALRRYLAEFLWDPRVVEIPRPLWWLILHGVILRVRPAQSAAKYVSIWTEAGSPLLAIARRQAAGVQARLSAVCRAPVHVALGMRYGEPSIAAALRELRERGCERILLLPLYPQYSASTTASAFDAVAAELRRWRWVPELRTVGSYHDAPGYIDALAASVRTAWAEAAAGERLLFSFHGLPRRNLELGDPYFCQCHKTARLVAERLQLGEGRWAVAFQSRFGRAEWLQPYTSVLLAEWARAGVRRADVICPGFSADCLETLEEIAVENRDTFVHAGGEALRYIPALNDTPAHLDLLVGLIRQHCGGWPTFDAAAPSDTRTPGRTRALALGAAD